MQQKIMYIGDVPVEASYHGSMLLYRLFSCCSPDRVVVVEVGEESEPARRIANCKYIHVALPCRRLLRSRVHGLVSAFLSVFAGRLLWRVRNEVASEKPDAIVTVIHGYGWIAASSLAKSLGVPLHVIVHDDWPRSMDRGLANAVIEGRFKACYRQAAMRYCVTPYMSEEYLRRYDCEGLVLYPSRGRDATACPVVIRKLEGSALDVAFAGTLSCAGYIANIRMVAESLQEFGGRVILYGPITMEQLSGAGLSLENVIVRGTVDSSKLVETLRLSADVLFVPMSFVAADRDNMAMAFPSKLTDYTLTGLPLLIHGPEYASVVRWAKENPGVAEVVTSLDRQEMDAAIRHLQDPTVRAEIAKESQVQGDRWFSHAAAEKVFLGGLKAPLNRSCGRE